MTADEQGPALDRRRQSRRATDRAPGNGWGVALVLGMVIFLLVLSSIVAVRRSNPEPARGYDDATRAFFVGSCVAGDESMRPVCRCAYDHIVQTISFDRFRDATVRGAGPSTANSSSLPSATSPGGASSLPAEFEAVLVGCLAEQHASSTATTALSVGTVPGSVVDLPSTNAPPPTSRSGGTVVRAQADRFGAGN